MDSTFLGQAAYTWKMFWVRLDWTYYCWNWKLKTENWKYCSKIIFKCVNSTMGPILNFFSAWKVLWTVMNSAWTAIFSPAQWTHVRLLFTHRGKKFWKRKRPSQTHTLYASFIERISKFLYIYSNSHFMFNLFIWFIIQNKVRHNI